MTNNANVIRLRQLVENSIPRKIKTPSDFTYLSGIIYERCRETISESTLKRIWGYIDGYDTVRFHTLSILARFVGYNDWDDFVNSNSEDSADYSDEILQRCIHSGNLKVGERVYFSWKPDRECIAEYLGDNTYRVLDCINSKLQKDNTFMTLFFIEGQSLYVDNLTADGLTFAMFVAGKNGGLKVVEKTEKEVL